jgi:hypothetical protein
MVVIEREMPIGAKPIGFNVIAILRANGLDHGEYSRTDWMQGVVIASYIALDAMGAKWTQTAPGHLPIPMPGFGAIPLPQNAILV